MKQVVLNLETGSNSVVREIRLSLCSTDESSHTLLEFSADLTHLESLRSSSSSEPGHGHIAIIESYRPV